MNLCWCAMMFTLRLLKNIHVIQEFKIALVFDEKPDCTVFNNILTMNIFTMRLVAGFIQF